MNKQNNSRIYTKEELKNIINTFRSLWKSERYIFNENNNFSVIDEFYHGACHYFSTALATILGIENTHIYNLYGLNGNGTKELIHSVIDYVPFQNSRKYFNRALHFRTNNDSCYDIQSPDGQAWDQAEYVFVEDIYENNCPFLQAKWNPELVWWEMEPVENIFNMLDSYEQKKASIEEINYFKAICSCLLNSISSLDTTQ